MGLGSDMFDIWGFGIRGQEISAISNGHLSIIFFSIFSVAIAHTFLLTEHVLRSIRGRHLSYQRSRHWTSPKTSLVKIEGVDDTEAAKYVSLLRGRGLPCNW